MNARRKEAITVGVAASTLALLGAGIVVEQNRASEMAGLAKVSDGESGGTR